MPNPYGQFVWYDYVAHDAAKAMAFYADVVGWEFRTWPGGDPSYRIVHVGETGTGGVMPMPEQAKAMGAPSHWLGYVCVQDCDGTVAKAKALGGTIYAPPFDIPMVGRCAVFTDPFGTAIGVIQPLGEMSVPLAHDPPQQGQFMWHEAMTQDAAASLGFFGQLFGWVKGEAIDVDGGHTYQLYRLPGMERDIGGMMDKTPEMPVSAFVYYVAVHDLDAATARAKARGAHIIVGPMPVPGGARIIMALDDQGGTFALIGQ